MERPKIQSRFMLLLLLLIIGASCQKEQETKYWEISPNSGASIIHTILDSIEFEFCLFDQDFVPSTIFNENENFYFHFSFMNNMQDIIVVSPEFINSEFFRVYQSGTNIDMGKPWTGIWCEYRSVSKTFNLNPTSRIQLNCPWVLTDISKPDYPLCMDENQDYQYLPKGEYFTKVELDFHFMKDDINYVINNKIFRIYFTIQ